MTLSFTSTDQVGNYIWLEICCQTTINCWIATNRKCSIQVGFDWFDRNTIHWDKKLLWVKTVNISTQSWHKEGGILLGEGAWLRLAHLIERLEGCRPRLIYGTGSCNTSLCVSPQPKCNYSLDITYSKILFISYDLLTTNRICKDFEVAFK